MGIVFNDVFKDVSSIQNINDLLILADILITDYSSIAFDFSILEKPIISFAYDYEEYKKDRGLYYDLDKMYPGALFYNENDLLNHIKSINELVEQEKTKKLKTKFVQGKGEATEICIDYLKKEILKRSKEL